MSYAAAVVAIVLGVIASACMFVLLVAGAPNSTPEAIRNIKVLMLSVAVVGFAGCSAAIWLLFIGRPWTAAGAGISPAVYVVVLLVVLLVRGT